MDNFPYNSNLANINDIDLTAPLSDWKEVSRALRRYGLSLVIEERTVRVLTLFKADIEGEINKISA